MALNNRESKSSRHVSVSVGDGYGDGNFGDRDGNGNGGGVGHGGDGGASGSKFERDLIETLQRMAQGRAELEEELNTMKVLLLHCCYTDVAVVALLFHYCTTVVTM
jgi:hypothetical protein